jgi:hypothetical protein
MEEEEDLDRDQLISDIKLLKEALAEDIDEGDEWGSDEGEDDEETVTSSLLNLDNYNLEELLNGDAGASIVEQESSLSVTGPARKQSHLDWQNNLKRTTSHLQGVDCVQVKKSVSCINTGASVSGVQKDTNSVQACLELNLKYQACSF